MRIVTDSGCDLPVDIKNNTEIPVDVVPITITVDGKDFVDDNTLDVAGFRSEMKGSKVVKTAAPSPSLYFERFKQAGSVFVVTLSSKLSASYNNAIIAKNQFLEEVGNKFIHIFDSMSAAAGETLVALKIKELIEKKSPEDKIVEEVNDYIKAMDTYFVLERYENIVRNGRIKPYIAKIAETLNIYPICGAEDGEIKMLSKAFGAKRAMAKMIDMITSKKIDFETRRLTISHVACEEKALEYKEKISNLAGFKEIIISEATGTISTYADQGGVVISF